MQNTRMITIALISGFAGAGLVWFTWSLFENIFARGGSKKSAPEPPEPAPEDKAGKEAEKPAARK